MAETPTRDVAELAASGDSPASTGLTSWWEALRTKTDIGELGVMLAVVAMSVAVRVLKLEPIEYYDDEVTRWHFVREWFHQHDFAHAQWTHHFARFGLNVPIFFAMLLFGRGASVYYVWPVVNFALQALLVYLTARRLGGRGAAVLAAVFLGLFAGLDRGASQLLPDTFGGTAMILVCYFLVRYQEASAALSRRWVIAAGLAFVWAYEIKESNLLFAPGAAAAVWLCRGRFRDGLVFCGVLVAAIALETLGFRLFTQYASRFAIVGEAHGDISASNFWSLFDRFTRLEPPWQMLFWMWVPSALSLASRRDRRAQALVVVAAAFLFLLTFMVRSIHPMVIWTRFYSRYFEPAAPLLVVVVAVFVADAASRMVFAVTPSALQPWLEARIPRLLRFSTAISIVVCVLTALAQYAVAKESLPRHALVETRRISTITNDAYRRNLPIVMRRAKSSEPEERRVRPLKLVYGIYLKDSLILTSDLAKNDRLPPILDAVRTGPHYAFVVRDARAYRGHDIEDWIERGCALVLTEEKNHLNAGPGVPSLILKDESPLPSNCTPP